MLPLAGAAALAAGLGYLARAWPAPELFVVPADHEELEVMAMTGDLQVAGIDTEHCLAMVDDWVRRPNWELTLSTGVSGCLGEDHRDRLTVDAAGDAVWSGGGLPARPLHLSPTQLAELHEVATLSCERPADDSVGYASSFVDVHWGSREAPARRVYESPAHAQLDAFIDDAVVHYRHRRLAERAAFRATVTVPPYAVPGIDRPMKVSFDGRGALEVKLRGRTVKAEPLDVEALVDAIDWVELGGPDALPVPHRLMRALDQATFHAGLQD